MRVAVAMVVLLTGCMIGCTAEPPAYASAEEAATAAGLDPAELLGFGDHVAMVRRGANGTILVTSWRLGERGWTFESESSTTRIGPLADAVIMGGALDTSWPVHFAYGFLPPGVWTIEAKGIDGTSLRVSGSGAYVLVYGDATDPDLSEVQTFEWRMRDASGEVVREGTGDCCLQVED
jgi:hypothetical protein